MTAVTTPRNQLWMAAGAACLALGLTGCIQVEAPRADPPASSPPPTSAPASVEPSTEAPPADPTTPVPPSTAPPFTAPPTAGTLPPVSPSTPPSAAPLSWPDLIQEVESGVAQLSVTTCTSSGTGTGFLISPDLVVTAAHVVSDASAISITLPSATVTGSIVGINELADLALVRADSPLAGHQFGFHQVDPPLGTEVAALGFPFGAPLQFTRGTISGLDRHFDSDIGRVEDILQTDTAVNRGNSGGPLLTQDGRVAGVISAFRLDGEYRAEGIAYAVSGHRAQAAADEWQERQVAPQAIGCGEAPAPGAGHFPLTIRSNHDQAQSVGQSLLLHGQAINIGAYEAAYKQLGPAQQRFVGGIEEWSAGLGSSYWRSLQVDSVEGSGNALLADVSLRTIQDPEFSDWGQDCSDWRIRYSMEWNGDAWLIAGTRLPFGDPVSC